MLSTVEMWLLWFFWIFQLHGHAHVSMYQAANGTALSYRSQLVHVADLPGRRSLHSARTNRLLVSSIKLSTVGGRAFPDTRPIIWRTMWSLLRLCRPSVSVWKHCYSSLVPWRYHRSPLNYSPTFCGTWSDFITWATLKSHDWLTDWYHKTNLKISK